MPSLFWTGKLTRKNKFLINTSSIFAMLNGSTRNIDAMKEHVTQGYNGAYSNHVKKYDALALKNQRKAAEMQLSEIDFRGKQVLDVGGGTGILSFVALEKGASQVVCGYISQYMLDKAKENANAAGYTENQLEFRQLDAESLPFENESFDITMTGMAFGLYPNPQKAVDEMARVTRLKGLVSVGAHGPEHYWEAINATLSSVTKRYVFGYRMEFWPWTDRQVENMLVKAGLTSQGLLRVVWRNDFPSGGEMYDFFAAVTASFWFAKLPKDRVSAEAEKTRAYCERNKLRRITDDVVFAYGIKFSD